MFEAEHLEKVKAGLICFNEREFWQCHEVLEDVWLEDANDPVRNVYWAIIQVATALFHYRNGNLIGAQGMLSKSKEKFLRCEQMKIESELLKQKLNWITFKNLVFSVPKESRLEDFKKLHDFKFEEYWK